MFKRSINPVVYHLKATKNSNLSQKTLLLYVDLTRVLRRTGGAFGNLSILKSSKESHESISMY